MRDQQTAHDMAQLGTSYTTGTAATAPKQHNPHIVHPLRRAISDRQFKHQQPQHRDNMLLTRPHASPPCSLLTCCFLTTTRPWAQEIGPFETIGRWADGTICTRIRCKPPSQDTGKPKLAARKWRQGPQNGTIATGTETGPLTTLPLGPTDRASASTCLHSHIAIRRLQKRAGIQLCSAPPLSHLR